MEQYNNSRKQCIICQNPAYIDPYLSVMRTGISPPFCREHRFNSINYIPNPPTKVKKRGFFKRLFGSTKTRPKRTYVNMS